MTIRRQSETATPKSGDETTAEKRYIPLGLCPTYALVAGEIQPVHNHDTYDLINPNDSDQLQAVIIQATRIKLHSTICFLLEPVATLTHAQLAELYQNISSLYSLAGGRGLINVSYGQEQRHGYHQLVVSCSESNHKDSTR